MLRPVGPAAAWPHLTDSQVGAPILIINSHVQPDTEEVLVQLSVEPRRHQGAVGGHFVLIRAQHIGAEAPGELHIPLNRPVLEERHRHAIVCRRVGEGLRWCTARSEAHSSCMLGHCTWLHAMVSQ